MNLTEYPITATDEFIRVKEQTCFLVDTTISDTEPIYIVPSHLLIDVKQFQEAVVVIIDLCTVPQLSKKQLAHF